MISIISANYDIDVVKKLPEDFRTGIYCGWASVDNGDVHKMVMSVGWNPFFDNKEKSVVNISALDDGVTGLISEFIDHFQETHIMHTFPNPDLYGKVLKVCITDFLRTEANFTTMENLISAINDDIANAHRILDSNPQMKTSSFFTAAHGDNN